MGARSRIILMIAGVLLAIGVMLGAMGAHMLRASLAPDALRLYGTAVDYHFYNALGLLGLGAVARSIDAPLLSWSAALIVAGVALFSGSLYALAFGAPRALGMVTPLGGLAMIAGWLVFALAVWRKR